MLTVVATAADEAQAELISGRLAAAGIQAVHKRNIGADNPAFGGGGVRDVYVEERDAARARELLEPQQFSDAELDELSEREYEDITGHEPGS